ncbi:MAG: enoyl-ACP reductase [Oligoflexales bacterium]
MGLFTGKTGIIMGVANERSIATHVAKFLADEGATLGFSFLPDKDEGHRYEDRVRKIVEPLGSKLLIPCDVSNTEDVAAFFKQVKEAFGTIDFLVHAIAFAPTQDLRSATIDVSKEGFLKAMDISVYSLINATRAAQPLMNKGGSVCTMSYYGGEKVIPGYNIMGLCKSALEMTVKYLAWDLGKDGLRINALSAGPIRTLASAAIKDFRKMLNINAMTAPMQRNVTVEEVAKSTAYLLSDLSSGVTGEVHYVDAGYNVMGFFAGAANQE